MSMPFPDSVLDQLRLEALREVRESLTLEDEERKLVYEEQEYFEKNTKDPVVRESLDNEEDLRDWTIEHMNNQELDYEIVKWRDEKQHWRITLKGAPTVLAYTSKESRTRQIDAYKKLLAEATGTLDLLLAERKRRKEVAHANTTREAHRTRFLYGGRSDRPSPGPGSQEANETPRD